MRMDLQQYPSHGFPWKPNYVFCIGGRGGREGGKGREGGRERGREEEGREGGGGEGGREIRVNSRYV